MKDVGIVGLPHSGKTTLFNALTRSGSPGGRANQAVVEVPDARVDELARLESSRRRVYARVRFFDVPGGLNPQAVAEHRRADALCIVVRAFGPGADPAGELAEVTQELLLADLAAFESGLEKARKKARSERVAARDVAALERARSLLESERPLRDERWEEADLKLLRGFGPLTLKPWVVVANIEEGAELPPGLPGGALAVSAALEAEVAGMDDREARELLAGFGVERPGLDRVVEASYRALDLITFLTTGPDESRAWEVRRGARAPEAAGVIHSDMERGFIRAEVVSYEDLVSAGSWAEVRRRGLLRVEGRDYVVAEGDVLSIRFAV